MPIRSYNKTRHELCSKNSSEPYYEQSIRFCDFQPKVSNNQVYLFIFVVLSCASVRSYGVMAITLDFESNNPSSNLGRTFPFVKKFKCMNGKGWISPKSFQRTNKFPTRLVHKKYTPKMIYSYITRASLLQQNKPRHDSLLG